MRRRPVFQRCPPPLSKQPSPRSGVFSCDSKSFSSSLANLRARQPEMVWKLSIMIKAIGAISVWPIMSQEHGHTCKWGGRAQPEWKTEGQSPLTVRSVADQIAAVLLASPVASQGHGQDGRVPIPYLPGSAISMKHRTPSLPSTMLSARLDATAHPHLQSLLPLSKRPACLVILLRLSFMCVYCQLEMHAMVQFEPPLHYSTSCKPRCHCRHCLSV